MELLPYVKSLMMMLDFFQKLVDTCNSKNALNSDAESISYWAYQWKM